MLVEWEVLEVEDFMKAVEIASSRCPTMTVELWSEHRKIAVFKPTATRRPQ